MEKGQQLKSSKGGTYTRDHTNCTLRAMEGDGNERKFELSFSSEEPYTRYWGVEILDHSAGAIDLTRLEEIGCVLFNHNRDSVIGKVNRVWIDNNRGCAEIEFDKDDEAERIYQKVSSGTLKGVSVGYRVEVWEKVEVNKKSTDGRFTGPAEIATRWMPFEISIVSVPADATVGVGRDMEENSRTMNTPNCGRALAFYEWQLKINQNLM